MIKTIIIIGIIFTIVLIIFAATSNIRPSLFDLNNFTLHIELYNESGVIVKTYSFKLRTSDSKTGIHILEDAIHSVYKDFKKNYTKSLSITERINTSALYREPIDFERVSTFSFATKYNFIFLDWLYALLLRENNQRVFVKYLDSILVSFGKRNVAELYDANEFNKGYKMNAYIVIPYTEK